MDADKLAAIDPMHLAWLLRAELRRGHAAGDPIPDWFHMWWTVDGRREYPAWPAANRATSAHLLHPMPSWPSYGAFGMTPALHYLIETREDLRSTFDVHTDAGLWHAIAWFYTHGLREYRLTQAADVATLAALDSIPPFLKNPVGDTCPELTWLMFFVWRCSNELQKAFDLSIRAARLEYLQWFLFEGITNLELSPVVSDRWRHWLRSPIKLDQWHPMEICRAGYLMWQRRADLQKAFDLRSPDGKRRFASWTSTCWQVERSLHWVEHHSTNPAQPVKHTQAFGLNLIGYAFGELGIGEDVRMAAASCEAAGIPYRIVNINPGTNTGTGDDALKGRAFEANDATSAYATNVFCLTAFETARVILDLGPRLLEGKKNIGWWPWELPVWPRAWQPALTLVDEIWAATTFTYQMYCEAVQNLIEPPTVSLMPMAASVDRLRIFSRKHFGIPSAPFVFLYVFDFNSYIARKNPFALLDAFQEAFGSQDSSVRLVFKTMNSDNSNSTWRHFRALCADDARVVVIESRLSRGEVLGLINTCDAYVSLHRSEGLGRTLAEAMLLAKPVISTDFSGSTDFVADGRGFPVPWSKKHLLPGDYPFIEEDDHAWWADAKIPAAAAALQAAKQQFLNKNHLSEAIHQYAVSNFAPRRIGQLMAERLGCGSFDNKPLQFFPSMER